MDRNAAYNNAKNDFNTLKNDPSHALKLAWYYPLIAGLLLLVLTTVLFTIAWWAVGLGLLLTAILGYQESQKMPSLVKVAWYWILIPCVALAVLLIFPILTKWIVGVLGLWAVIAILVKKPWQTPKTPTV